MTEYEKIVMQICDRQSYREVIRNHKLLKANDYLLARLIKSIDKSIRCVHGFNFDTDIPEFGIDNDGALCELILKICMGDVEHIKRYLLKNKYFEYDLISKQCFLILRIARKFKDQTAYNLLLNACGERKQYVSKIVGVLCENSDI